MTTKLTLAAAGLAVLLGGAGLAGAAFANAHDTGGQGATMPGMGGHTMGGETMGGDQAQQPATGAFEAANQTMMEAMAIEPSGDPDIDFARAMIGHHQGAIEMARVALEYGEDPDLRQLAEEIIEAQEGEIEFLEGWLAANGQ